jgi:AcrR family transcriptional regulator
MTTTVATSYHHGNLRAVLLEQAERRLEERGAAGLSLRELARDVGVSHGAPRHYFSDKQALLDGLVVRGLERLGTELDAALARPSSPFEERLAAFARGYVSFATRHSALLALMFARKDQADRPDLLAANNAAFAAPTALIDSAIANRDIVTDEPDQVAMAVLATLQGLATIITSGMIAGRDPDTVIVGTIHTLTHGLRGSGQVRSRRPRSAQPG